MGIITDRDLVVEVLAMDLDYEELRAGDVMTANPTLARESDSIFETISLMQRSGVRRLPVVDVQSRLVGIVSFDDVVELLAQELGGLARAIRHEQRVEAQSRK